MSHIARLLLLALIASLMLSTLMAKTDDRGSLALHLRSRAKTGDKTYVASGRVETWPAEKTALVICDMWNDHWCRGAARRVAELAGPMNEMVRAARDKGVFIVHCPSTCMKFYKDAPQRLLAQKAPFAATPIPLSTAERWGTAWCWPDGAREGVLPIDDSDMGCDCDTKCTIRDAWTREIATVEISPHDAITDNGQELWNLLQERKIDRVLICGVHLNMCVLGRPFGIRQLTKLGLQLALVRDMTDTMYDHERPPGVNHFRGTDLVVEHVEKFWCPSIVSTDITGKPAFRFHEDASTASR
jgi:nicotinamidase-related amidase